MYLGRFIVVNCTERRDKGKTKYNPKEKNRALSVLAGT